MTAKKKQKQMNFSAPPEMIAEVHYYADRANYMTGELLREAVREKLAALRELHGDINDETMGALLTDIATGGRHDRKRETD